MDGVVHIQDESILCRSCVHCENECNASPESKVLDCQDYERRLSDIFKVELNEDPNLLQGMPDTAKSDYEHVNHPHHYTQGGIECIKCIEASMKPEGFQDYCKGNVIKYIHRWREKGGLEDLKKAAVYLNWMIESAEKGHIS